MKKYKKSRTKTIILKYLLHRRIINSKYLTDHIIYQIFNIIFSISSKNEKNNNPPIKIYVNKIKNRINFRIKIGYYFELLTPETMKLLGSTKSKVTKYENDKNVPCSEIARIVLVYCNIVNNNYQHNSRVLHAFVPNILFGRLQDISSKNLIF